MGNARPAGRDRAGPSPISSGAGRDRRIPAGRLVPLGDNAVFAAPESGRVAVLNPAARFACEALATDRPLADIAADYARRFRTSPARAEQELRELHRDFRRLLRPPRRPPPDTSAVVEGTVELDGVYAAGPRPVRLTVAGSPRLARLLRFLLRPAAVRGPARPRLTVVKRGRHYDIRHGGRLLTRTDDLLLARSETLRHLLLLAHGRRRWLAFLHAAAIAGERGAWVIAGASGSGKSTLAAALLGRGFSLVTDDYAPVEAGSGLLHRVPFAVGIKDASIDLLRDRLPDLLDVPPVRFRGRVVRYLPPPMPDRDRLPVAGLLFPLHDPASEPSLTPLAPEEAFALCAGGGGWFEGSPRRLAELVEWFRRRPAWAVTYPDTPSALDLLRPLLGDGR